MNKETLNTGGFSWPDGYKSCVTVTLDVDSSSLEYRRLGSTSGAYSLGDYGPKCGVPRLLDLAAKHGVKFTFFIPGWVAERFPERVKEIHDEGHDVAGHGYLHERAKGQTDEEAIDKFRKSQQIIKDITGTTMRGWRPCGAGFTEKTYLGWYKLGWRYIFRDWKSYYPYRAKLEGKEVDLLTLPCSTILDDFNYFWGCTLDWYKEYGGAAGQYAALSSPDDALDYWMAELETTHEVGGTYAITCHPRAIGRPLNIKVLDKIIGCAKQTSGVWIAPVSAIADWVLRK